jgi:hypothetical protein
LEGINATNDVEDLALDGDHRGRVEQHIGEHDDDVGGAGPRGDDVDPNGLHECASSVGEGVVGTAALQQLNEDVPTFDVVWKSSDTGEPSHRRRGCQVPHGGDDCLRSGQFYPL